MRFTTFPTFKEIFNFLQSEKVIVIVHSHHGPPEPYLCQNAADLIQLCLNIIQDRSYAHWFDEAIIEIDKPQFTKEQISQMRDGSVKQAALDEWEDYKNQILRQQRKRFEFELLQQALRGDGESAYTFLRCRQDFKDEQIEIHKAERPLKRS